jgi:hypothetical protein
MKNNKSTGFDGIPVKMWEMFCNMKEATEMLKNMFNKARRGKESPHSGELLLFMQFTKGRANSENQALTGESHFYQL